MNKSRVLAFIGWLTISIFLVVGCNATTPSSETTQDTLPVSLTVSVAASVTDAMENIKSLYSQEQPNVTITYNFGSSGSLQQQIEQGAPVDIFLSAAAKQMDALQQKDLLVPDTRQNLLENEVVLIVPQVSDAIAGFQDLTSATVERIAIGEPESVPAGKYAQETLTSLNLFALLETKLVLAKDVRQVLSYVATGNVDAGIVYATDAKISDQVKAIAVAPAGSPSPVVYPIAVLKSSKNVEAATEFVQFLFDTQAQAVFEQYGFKAVIP